MFLLAAAAAAATAPATLPPPRRDGVTIPVAAEAIATVRIVRGVRVSLGSDENPGAPPAHDGKVKSDGKELPARLIEFE